MRSRRRSARSSRGRAGGVGGITGAGARSPGRMPAFKASTVGRKTLTCLVGPAGAFAGALTGVGADAGPAEISPAGAASAGATGDDTGALGTGAGGSARTAGV